MGFPRLSIHAKVFCNHSSALARTPVTLTKQLDNFCFHWGQKITVKLEHFNVTFGLNIYYILNAVHKTTHKTVAVLVLQGHDKWTFTGECECVWLHLPMLGCLSRRQIRASLSSFWWSTKKKKKKKLKIENHVCSICSAILKALDCLTCL